MDRAAVLLNLRDLRDLELTKVVMTKKREEEWQTYEKEINNLSAVEYAEIKPVSGNKKEIIFSALGVLIGTIITSISLMFTGSGEGWPPILNIIAAIYRSPGLAVLGLIIGFPMFGFSLYLLYHALDSAEKERVTRAQNEAARQYNVAEDVRIAINQPQIGELRQLQQEQDAYWRDELEKVEDLLTDSYSVNLIPQPYRHKLAAIQYIYEYMSSAPVSLEHTLLSTQLEDGIRRIEAKMNIIITQQYEQIFQMHRQEAHNKQLLEQNEQMLDSLQRAETNALEISQYTQLIEGYHRTNSFFATMDYLDNQK